MKVVTVLPDTSLLADVKALWRKNSDTLGMMPDGGFDDHAERKRILGLVDGSELQGYLMYRVSRNRANIVHLCVTESCRGKRASRILIDELIESTRHLFGIELRCRRDFVVSALWPKLGFVPIGERRGRALAGSILTVWAIDYGKPTLLSTRSQSRV
jgi:ribosomal protein S18 acetylase RimI-like enzyme